MRWITTAKVLKALNIMENAREEECVMDMYTAELVAKIKDDIGVEKVVLRPVAGEWAILHPIDYNRAETLYRSTKEECESILKMCWEV